MKYHTWFTLTAALAALAAAMSASAQDADTKLDAFFHQYLEETFHQRPTEATRLGDHRFDNLLDDISAQTRAGWLAHARRTLDQLPKQVDKTKLTRDGQVDFEVFQHHLETEIWLAQNFHPFADDPRTYGEYINGSVYALLTQSTLPRETNLANALARMAEIPRVLAVARSSLAHPPKVMVDTAIRQNRGAISFYEKDIFQLAGDTPQLDRLKSSCAAATAALRDYQKFLEDELAPRATGEWRAGRAKFSRKLELELDAGLTADQVFADAQAEFARVRGDMFVIARQLWNKYYPTATPLPDDPQGRRETINKVIAAVNQEHGRPEDLARDARATVENIKTFIRERDILRLPDPDLCQVIEMPEFQRGNAVAFMESAPPLDPKAASFYDISPPPAGWTAAQVNSFLEEYNRHLLQILTIHEAYPGHYVQLAYASRNPSLIRKIFASGPYVEGWAVYGEQTMLDCGYGAGDLRLRLMQQKFYLRAVANAILDHNMHCANLSDEDALKFLMDDAFQSEGEARLKVIRAKQSSAQLSTYFVGRMAHYRLRQSIERELGDRFDLGRFHEAVLFPGSVPVKYLPELVRARLGRPR
jgi:uncharacterized protein (DUF885 family)